MRAIATLAAVCLLATACTADANSSPASPSRGPTRTAPPAPTPSATTALRITSPHSGAVLDLPATVQYELDAAPSDAVIRIYTGTSPVGGHRDFTLTGPRGSITLPDDKTLTGHRTLTFCLVAGERLIDGTCQTLILTMTGRK